MNDTVEGPTLDELADERANWPADLVILEAVLNRSLLLAILRNMDALTEVVQSHADPTVVGSIERAAGALTAIGIMRDHVHQSTMDIDQRVEMARREWAQS